MIDFTDNGSTGITPPTGLATSTHASVEKGVVCRSQFTREDSSGLPDVEHAMVGGDDESPMASEIHLDRLGVCGM
jgi:hypothetical protein